MTNPAGADDRCAAGRRQLRSNRRRRLLLASGALLAAPYARAQTPVRGYRVGAIVSFSPQMDREYMAALREQLATHGLIDGRNLVIKTKSAWTRKGAQDAAGELIAGGVDALFVVTTFLALGARSVTQSVPIVFAWVAEPALSGLVADGHLPGGNATGVSSRYFELTARRLELVRELVPGAMRVGVISAPLDPIETALRLAQPTADRLGMALIHEVGGLHWEAGIEAAIKAGAEALLFATPFSAFGLRTKAQQVIQLAMQRRLPAVYADRESVELGGLVSLATNPVADLRRAADHLARVLKGAPPAGLPVDQGSDSELTLNLATARELGLTVPASILGRARAV